jgi:hypothetical protein
MVLPEAWKSEIAKGTDWRALARALVKRRMLVADGQQKSTQSLTVPGYGKMRLYVFADDVLTVGEDDGSAR